MKCVFCVNSPSSILDTLGCQLADNTAYCSKGSQQTNWVRDLRLYRSKTLATPVRTGQEKPYSELGLQYLI